MKKIYSFVVAAIMSVLGFSASAEDVSFTLAINDASHVEASYYGDVTGWEDVYITLVNGANELSIPAGCRLYISVTNKDYFIRRANASDSEGNDIDVYFWPSSVNVAIDEQWQGAKCRIEVANYSEVRSSMFTLICDKPENIRLSSNDNYPAIQNEEEQQIWFDPEDESEWILSSTISRPFYSVQLNGVEQQAASGNASTYYLTLKNDDVLNVVCTFPENPIPVHFEFPNEATEAVFVSVDDVLINDLAYVHDGFTVNKGSLLSIERNSNEYDDIKILVNGFELSPYSDFNEYIMEETTITVTATKKATYTVTLEVNEPDGLEASVNGKYLDLVTGVNYFYMTNNSILHISPVQGYLITDFSGTANGEKIYTSFNTNQANFYFESKYGNNCNLKIEVKPIAEVYTESCTVNLKGSARYANIRCADIETDLYEGDNIINFPKDNNGWTLNIDPVPYKVLWNGTEVESLYDDYGYYSPDEPLANGDVIEIIMVNEDAKGGLVTINCTDERAKSLVSIVSYWINRGDPDEKEVTVTDWETPFEVPANAWIGINVDYYQTEFGVELTANGQPVDLEEIYGQFRWTIDGNLDVVISTYEYVEVNYTINIENAQAVSVEDQMTYDRVKLVDGTNNLTIIGGTNIRIYPEGTEYEVVSITDGEGNVIPKYADEWMEYDFWQIKITEGMVININTQKIEYDNEAVVYIGSGVKGYLYYGDFGQIEMNNSGAGYYTTFGFNGEEIDVFVNVGIVDAAVYCNNEPLDNLYADHDSFMARTFVAPNGVVKVFASEPFMAEVTIADAESEITSVVTDLVVEQTASEFEALEGTLIELAVKDGAKVKCNDEEMAVADGVCKITVNAEAMNIVVTSESGIESIAADRLNGKVYNMQGIEIKKGNLTPGLYIVNGKKTYVK